MESAIASPLPSPNPPLLEEHHVRVPEELAAILGADAAHTLGFTGRGVKVAVIDSGFYPHPYYSRQDYRIQWVATPNDPEPASDVYGHGTAQLACLLSIAPEAEVFAIKCMDVDPSAAIERALELGANVISCAWGFDIDRPGKRKLPKDFEALHALIEEAVRSGVCVVAAAGNGQYSFPGSMPSVISAGGVFYGADRAFHPSDLSSSYESSFFPGRQVPDLCGLAGNLPHGRLLLLPVPPKAKLAKRPGFRPGATTAQERRASVGWALFSGTSAATAMISGAAALLLEASPGLAPEALRTRLITRSRQVLSSHMNREGDGHYRVLDLRACFAEQLAPEMTEAVPAE
jgi:serine protease AprX